MARNQRWDLRYCSGIATAATFRCAGGTPMASSRSSSKSGVTFAWPCLTTTKAVWASRLAGKTRTLGPHPSSISGCWTCTLTGSRNTCRCASSRMVGASIRTITRSPTSSSSTVALLEKTNSSFGAAAPSWATTSWSATSMIVASALKRRALTRRVSRCLVHPSSSRNAVSPTTLSNGSTTTAPSSSGCTNGRRCASRSTMS
mmetsp:Transcript_69697/g.180787  ORF Transcript_69697/g.180787 Transcript_69697/m.180787 type:complete len:202 (-) Transcript_69697:65-670(-)